MQGSSQIITTNKPTLNYLQARCSSRRPTNSVRALKGKSHSNCSQQCMMMMTRRTEASCNYATLKRYGCTSGNEMSNTKSSSVWFGIFGTYSCRLIASTTYSIFSAKTSPSFSRNTCLSETQVPPYSLKMQKQNAVRTCKSAPPYYVVSVDCGHR